MRLVRRFAGLAVPAVLVLAPAAPAAAAGGIDIDVPSGGLTFERLAPGYGGVGDIVVSNGSEYDAEVALRVTDVVDDDNGCLRQESRDGDVTCDAGGGELSGWLRVSVERDGTAVWEGPMSALAEEGVVLDEAMPAGTSAPLRVRVLLPIAAGNDTMTDSVGFGLRVDATAGTGDTETEILGVEAAAGGDGEETADQGGVSGLLPFTGGDVDPWVPAVGLFLLGAGTYLLVSRRQGQSPEPA